MAHYLFQGNYSSAAVKALVDNPQDREAAVRPLFQAAGGKVHSFFFALGESDWIVVAELPDNSSAAAVAFAVASSPTLSNVRTTALLTPSEAMTSMEKAKRLTFKPATG